MPITTGSVTITGSGTTVKCGTQEIYDQVKADEAARGFYTLVAENEETLVLTFDVNKTVDVSGGALP